MRKTGTKYNSEENNYYQSNFFVLFDIFKLFFYCFFFKVNYPVNSLSNFLSTKPLGTTISNTIPNSNLGSNRKNPTKDSLQMLQKNHKQKD